MVDHDGVRGTVNNSLDLLGAIDPHDRAPIIRSASTGGGSLVSAAVSTWLGLGHAPLRWAAVGGVTAACPRATQPCKCRTRKGVRWADIDGDGIPNDGSPDLIVAAALATGIRDVSLNAGSDLVVH